MARIYRWYAIVPVGQTAPDCGTGSTNKREAMREAKRKSKEEGVPYMIAICANDPIDPDFCLGEITNDEIMNGRI